MASPGFSSLSPRPGTRTVTASGRVTAVAGAALPRHGDSDRETQAGSRRAGYARSESLLFSKVVELESALGVAWHWQSEAQGRGWSRGWT
jgi:hypothetical protein